jgi:hypothetical protein
LYQDQAKRLTRTEQDLQKTEARLLKLESDLQFEQARTALGGGTPSFSEKTEAPHRPAGIPFVGQAIENLITAIDELGSLTTIQALEDCCVLVSPMLKQAYLDQDTTGIDLKKTAQLLQLAYVSACNERNLAHYETLADTVAQLGIDVMDQLQGQSPLGNIYAENFPVSQYPSLIRFQNEEYPSPQVVRTLLEQREGHGGVAMVLQPAVVLRADGSETVLRKGAYLVF